MVSGTVAFIGLGHMDAPVSGGVASTASGQCRALSVNCRVPRARSGRPGQPGPPSAIRRLPHGQGPRTRRRRGRAGGAHAELGLKAGKLSAAYAERGGAGEDFSGIVRTMKDRSAEQR
ncbi:hypothetical protein GCM10010339_58670 [Streptomyces alanosinicus]|uniref:Uncharacterized protein n=1 Tax=Streptomyces alanosinicus TaxID=68171 RepID=A0A918YMJ6_9ACTN|nr:hypothetical protein GCM10010339_58670 [Streptomyces alanosinicus]